MIGLKEETKQAVVFYRMNNMSYCKLSRFVLVRYLKEVTERVMSFGKLFLCSAGITAVLYGIGLVHPLSVLEHFAGTEVWTVAGLLLFCAVGFGILRSDAAERFQSNRANGMDALLLIFLLTDLLFMVLAVVTGWSATPQSDWRLAYGMLFLSLGTIFTFCRIALYGTRGEEEREK